MVKPYCTLLVFTKENISFSKVALLSAHWSCLVGSVMITRGYRPWKTANTTADFYLLVKKTIIKTLKQKLKFVQAFFLSDIWQGGSLTQLMLITTPFQVRPESHREPRNEVGSQNLTERISGIRAGKLILPLLSVTCSPIVPFSPQKCTINNWPSSC